MLSSLDMLCKRTQIKAKIYFQGMGLYMWPSIAQQNSLSGPLAEIIACPGRGFSTASCCPWPYLHHRLLLPTLPLGTEPSSPLSSSGQKLLFVGEIPLSAWDVSLPPACLVLRGD